MSLRNLHHGVLQAPNNSTFTFTPTSIPNMGLWLDARDNSTITVTSGKVTQWVDKSPNSYIFTHTSSNNVNLESNTVNGKQAVRLNFGSPIAMTGSVSTAPLFDYLARACTLFIVFSQPLLVDLIGPPSHPAPPNYVMGWLSNSYQATLYLGTSSSVCQLGLHNQHTTGVGLNFTQSPGTPWMVSFNYNGSGATTAANWTIQLNRSTVTTVTDSYSDYDTGAAVLGGAGYTPDISIGEIFTFNHALTATEMSNMNSYLQTKWGF